MRARAVDEMAKRKQSIVDALRIQLAITLAKGNLEHLPSIDEIAKQAHVTKGVLYHYFSTKEEVYLTLLSQETQVLIGSTIDALKASGFDIEMLKELFVRICSNDLFMFLGSISGTLLETNISPEYAREFKLSSIAALDALTEVWHSNNPEVPVNDLRHFLLRIYLIALTLWRHHNPPQSVREAVPEFSQLWFFKDGFEASLKETFKWLWIGMNQSAGAGS